MTVSNIRWMLESFEVEGGGSAAAVGSTNASVVGSLEERGGGGGALEEDFTLGRLELALIWVALYRRKMAPMGAMMWTGSDAGNSSKPKCNKILWIKTRKNRLWAVELLLWTSTKDRMKRWGKLIGASVTRAYKNAYPSRGQVRDGSNRMARNLEKEIINFGQLVRSDLRINTPLDRRPNKIWHNIIKGRRLIVRIDRMLDLKHPKSKGHYRRSNGVLFTPNPTLHVLSFGIIGVDRKVQVELSDQGSWRRMINIHQRQPTPMLKVSPNLWVKLI